MPKPFVIKPDRRLAEEAHAIKTAAAMQEPPKEEVKVPVRDGDVWRCPDCNGVLKGEPLEDGLRCDECSIGWSVGFMTDLLAAEQVLSVEGWDFSNNPVVQTGDCLHVAISDGETVVLLSTEIALVVAARIQRLAAEGIIRLKE